jgi:ribonuclease P protein subunit RPR2
MQINKRLLVNEIVKERIDVLFSLAKEYAATDSELSREYVRHMKKISTHCRMKLPKEVKNGVCRKCDSVLIPGLNASVRIASSKRYVVYECLACKAERHVHY